MNPKFKELYSYLKSEGMTDLDENSFYSKYSDPNKSKEIYSYLKSNQMTDLDESSFHAAYFGGKKKEPTVSNLESDQKPSSSDTPKKKVTQPLESSGGDDGIYEYSGRKGAIYKKEKGKWFVDPDGLGSFVEIKDPSGSRYEVLNKQAKRIYNSPSEQSNVDWQTVPVEKNVNQAPSEEDQIKQKAFSESFSAKSVDDPKVIAQNRIQEAISSIDGKLVGRFNEDEFKKYFDAVLNSNEYTKGLFDIEPTGSGYNAVRIKNKYTGEYRDISLKNWSESRDNNETEIFKAFVDVNSKFSDLSKMQYKLNELESNRSNLSGMDRIEADREILELRDKIKIETKLRNNYALSDKYRAAAVFNESTIGKINDDMTKIQLESIDISEENNELSNWESEVVAAVNEGRISEDDYNQNYAPNIEAQKSAIMDKAVSVRGKAADLSTTFEDLNILAGLNYSVQEDRGNILTGTAASFIEGAESVLRFAFENTTGLEDIEKGEISSQFIPGIVTKEYLTSEDRTMFEQAIFGVSNSFGSAAAGMIVPGAGQVMGLYASSYMNMKDQMNTPEFADVPEYEKIILSGTYGVVISALERFGIDRMLSKTPIGRNAANWILGNTLKSLPKNATSEIFEAAVNENIKAAISKGVINTAGAALVEGGTEAIQELADISIKSVYNIAKETDIFDTPNTIGEALGQIGEAGVLGMIGGGSIASVNQAVQTPRDMRTAAQFNEMAKAIEDKNLSDIVKTSIKGKVLYGEMTKAEADAIIKEMDESKAILDKIPSDVKPEQKFSAFNLINERSQLEQDIQGKDENLTIVQRERIKEINTELQNISRDAVQEQATGEVPVQSEARVGEEVVEGESKAEPEVVTEESKEEVAIDKPTIATNAKSELDRVKTVAMEAEDGATFNLDGTKYDGGGLIVPVASKNTTVEEVTPEMIADFVEENAGKIGDQNSVKVGIYKFPNSNEVSIDLNVVAPESSREAAIEFGKKADQESLFDLSTFENVKTGGTGMNPKSFSDEQFKEIAKALNEGRVPDVFEQEIAPTEVTVENAEQLKRTTLTESGNERAPKIVQAAKNVIKALPNVKVHIHTNQDSYINGIAKAAGVKPEEITDEQGAGRSNGRYVNGEIHIDLSAPNVDGATIYHEAFHHALLQSGKTAENMVEMVNGLKKALGSKHKDLVGAVDRFVSMYSGDEGFSDMDRAEEFLSELGGLLAESAKTLDTTTLQRVVTIINRMAEKLIGRPVFKSAANRQEVVDFMNSLSKGMARGEKTDISSDMKGSASRKKRMSEPVAGNKLFNEPLKDATTIAKSYMGKKGMEYVEVEKISKLDEDLSKRIADAYDAMKNDPTDPEVKAAYEAMANETLDQYSDIVAEGYVVEINNSEPYSSSGDMINDLRENKRMKIFSTESGFGDDPITDQQREENILLRDSGMKDVNGETLLINDVFRFVHDFFGHAKLGNGFGPIGEENAWRVHAVMYTDLARRAMTSETRGQNSWVNFSGVNEEAFKKRDKARELRKQGKIDEADALVGEVYEEMQFADQKMGLMPEWTATEGSPIGKKRMAGKGKSSTQKKIDKETGVTKTKKKVTVNESTALKDQIRLEARAAREAKGDMKAKQKALIDSINDMRERGILTTDQVAAMLNRIKKLNLDNSVAVAEFLDYSQRVFEKADYQATLSEANNISRRIKKAIKSDKIQASTAAIAKAFSKIDPKYVDDIDAYMEMAQVVFDAVKSARVTTDGIDTKIAMDYESVSEYVDQTIAEQEKRKSDMLLDIYADMFEGVDTQDMKLSDIVEFVNAMKENPKGVSSEEKARQTRTFIQKMVEAYTPIIKQILRGTDPFTGEDVFVDQKAADIMSELLEMDMSDMDVRDAIAIVEAMDNFVVNQSTDGIEAVVATQRGIKNAKALKAEGLKARSMSTIGRDGGTTGFGRYWVGSIMTLKTASDLIFKGVNSAVKVLKSIGVTAFENGVASAKKMWTNYVNEYESTFAKKKPNGKSFMDAENIYERGMYAFIKRTVTGDVDTQAKELSRKIKLIKDSVEVLRKYGGNKHKMAADMYEALIDKLGLNEEGITVADIEQRVDPINKDAVNWWVDTWAKHYSDLYDVSANVYNTKLDKDMFYTPDKYSTLQVQDAKIEESMSQGGGFAMVNGFEYDKKSGVLMPSKKPASLETQRYVDLNFDMNNSKSLKAALTDIKTAASIRQIKGALSSDAWIDIMPNKEDRDQFRKKVDNFILRARNKHVSAYDSDIIDALEKSSRVWASFGAARALAGVTQPFKQTLPLMISTMINTGGRLNILTPLASKDVNAWIDASGMGIANRGIESQSGIEDANRLLEDALQSGKMKRILLAIENANKVGLKILLSNPDIWIARSAFVSYYQQYMRNNGLDTEIDYSDPSKANQEALDYAQHMVDRQQNVSDSDMAGEFFAAGDAPRKLVRNIFFPFATFVMNQKSRMFSDFTALLESGASKQDKWVAAKSIGGLAAEISVYQALGWTIRAYGIKYLADALVGDDEEDKEAEEKAFKRQKQYMTTQILKDVLSPSPALDPFIVSGGDKVLKAVQKGFDIYEEDAKKALKLLNEQRVKDNKRKIEGVEADRWIDKYIAENRFELSDFENDSKYGMYSITYGKMAELHDSYVLAYEGKYSVEDNSGNRNTKYVMDKDRQILKEMFPFMVMYNAIGFPSEISSLNRKVENAVKKKGITEKTYDTYNEYLKETGKKSVSALEEEIIRTTKATDKKTAVERVVQKMNVFKAAGVLDSKEEMEKTLKRYKEDEEFRDFINNMANRR